MKNGFIKIAVAAPEVSVAAPLKNASEICRLIDKAYADGAHVIVFPELSVSGYTCGDLFFSSALIDGCREALDVIAKHTDGKKVLVFVGAPLMTKGKLYDCAVAINDGEILGVTPKTNVQSFDDKYDGRWFASYNDLMVSPDVFSAGDHAFFNVRSYFCAEKQEFVIGCEVGDDIYMTNSPADSTASKGATVIVNLAASGETVDAEEERRMLVKSESLKKTCAYVYSNASCGESTTDGVFSGHSLIAANGKIIAEKAPFDEREIVYAVVDTEHLIHDRMKKKAAAKRGDDSSVSFSLNESETDISGVIDPSPFIPTDADEERKACERILELQAYGLAKRIKAAHASGCIIGLSGGLDSTLALIASVKAMDVLGRSRKDITAVTMPCFGTTSRTRSNAEDLAVEFGTEFRCIDIKEAVDVHFRDIGHSKDDLSVVYENAQARERTQILMDIANRTNLLVVGTGDLSELALGWATYNGDQMSNYGVNGGIPKTLIRRVVAWYADHMRKNGAAKLADVLCDILDTPVSPELLPAKDGEIAQKTEDIVGPYELHDFFLYNFVRWGDTPEKIFRMAKSAFEGKYTPETILKWLNTFTRRFYIQQFKRSAIPDGVKIGSFGLSPRGDWKMPSDACPDEIKIK